jgi:hypothetical protein
MKSIEIQIVAYYHASFTLPANVQKINMVVLQAQLREAINIARARLQHICDDLDAQKRKSAGNVHLSKKVFDSCNCIISLLQVRCLWFKLYPELIKYHADGTRSSIRSYDDSRDQDSLRGIPNSLVASSTFFGLAWRFTIDGYQ